MYKIIYTAKQKFDMKSRVFATLDKAREEAEKLRKLGYEVRYTPKTRIPGSKTAWEYNYNLSV